MSKAAHQHQRARAGGSGTKSSFSWQQVGGSPLGPAVARLQAAWAHQPAAQRSIAEAFQARCLSVVADLTECISPRTMTSILAAPTTWGALLDALEQPAALKLVRRDDPLAAARIRGLRARQELLNAEGGTLSAEGVADRLNISRQAVDKRRRSGTLLAVATGRRGYDYPAWQFTDDGVLPGLADTLGELKDTPPWARLRFFLSGNERTAGERPLDLLRRGESDSVRRAARVFGEQGAA